MATILEQSHTEKIYGQERIRVGQTVATYITCALSDEFSRKIISSATADGKTVEEISEEQQIPLSTCYRRVKQLVDQGLVVIERIVVTGAGKRFATYRSSFRGVSIGFDGGMLVAQIELNPDVAEKCKRAWLAATYSPRENGAGLVHGSLPTLSV